MTAPAKPLSREEAFDAYLAALRADGAIPAVEVTPAGLAVGALSVAGAIAGAAYEDAERVFVRAAVAAVPRSVAIAKDAAGRVVEAGINKGVGWVMAQFMAPAQKPRRAASKKG